MDITRAKEIVEILADGINPTTGEVLPDSDSCNQAEVVRALHTVLKALDVSQQKSRQPKTENAGKPWTESDDRKLCEMYDAGYSKRELCEHFKRSSGAIDSRLVKLGKLQAR